MVVVNPTERRPSTSGRYGAMNEDLDGVPVTTTKSNIGDLAHAEILWKLLDALRGQIGAIRGIEDNLNSRSHSTSDSRTLSVVTKMSEPPEWR